MMREVNGDAIGPGWVDVSLRVRERLSDHLSLSAPLLPSETLCDYVITLWRASEIHIQMPLAPGLRDLRIIKKCLPFWNSIWFLVWLCGMQFLFVIFHLLKRKPSSSILGKLVTIIRWGNVWPRPQSNWTLVLLSSSHFSKAVTLAKRQALSEWVRTSPFQEKRQIFVHVADGSMV